MGRALAFVYAAGSYLIFLLTFLYLIGFVGNLFVPKSIDSGSLSPFAQALLINLLLLGLFAVQHSVMARPGFKRRWTRLIPQAIERSTYVLLTSLVLSLLFWRWRPMTDVVWSVESRAGRYFLTAVFWVGWVVIIISTFLINHLELFGLRQVYLYGRGQEHTETGFKTPALYKLVRHPILLGFILAFWSAPRMTVGHLIFATVMTAYTLLGIQFEERDLMSLHGAAYGEYRQRVSMLLPLPKKRHARPGSRSVNI